MREKPKLLYVEDDLNLGYVTQDNLQLKGYEVKHCTNGLEAKAELEQTVFDLCILDVMLPKLDGFSLAEEIRKSNKHVPIIFLTAKSLKEDKLKGLKLGGDDYITKPFSIEELILKIEVFLKRSKVVSPQTLPDVFSVGLFHFDFNQLCLSLKNEEKILTQKEAELLRYLALNPNTVLKREEILKNIWGDDDYFNGRSMDVFISRLRAYLKADASIEIKNVHGVGFIFHAEVVIANA